MTPMISRGMEPLPSAMFYIELKLMTQDVIIAAYQI